MRAAPSPIGRSRPVKDVSRRDRSFLIVLDVAVKVVVKPELASLFVVSVTKKAVVIKT